MLKIRKEQNDELAKVALRRFEDNMVKHAREHFPKLAEIVGEQGIRKTIRLGLERSKAYGFETEHEACLYVDLMIMLGGGFDTDPQLPWVKEILASKDISNTTERIDALYNRAMKYLNQVVGRDNVFPMNALRKVRAYTIGQLEERLGGDVVRNVVPLFREIWPAKCDCMGSATVGRMIGNGIESALKYGIKAPGLVGIYLLVMFLLGHHFDSDPIYPWASEILADDSIAHQGEKIHLLHAKAMALLEQVLS